jgi:hypothetical protein
MKILKDGRDLNNSVFIVESHEVDSNGNFLKLYFESTNNSKRKIRLVDNNKEYLINVGEYLDKDYNLYVELKLLLWIKGLYHILVNNIKNKKYNSKLELTDASVESIKEVDLVEHIKIITKYGYFDDILVEPLKITTQEILDIIIKNDYSFYGSIISKNKLFIMLNDYMERDTEVYEACDKDYFIADVGLEDSLEFLFLISNN